MIFSEIYGLYYEVMQKLIKKAMKKPLTPADIKETIYRNAFAESAVFLEESVNKGRWQLICSEGSVPFKHLPLTPLSLLQKRWMKAISLDPRMSLFKEDISGLEDVRPLFYPEDICYFDQFGDGDDFADTGYMQRFRMILEAITRKKPLRLEMISTNGQCYHAVVLPQSLEYSERDNKFRLLAKSRSQKKTINLGRILTCSYYEKDFGAEPRLKKSKPEELKLILWDERNALERAFLHFAHFEKEAKKINEKEYELKLFYEKEDETEVLIRILSFGPFLKVLEPACMVAEVRKRLRRQQKLMSAKTSKLE